MASKVKTPWTYHGGGIKSKPHAKDGKRHYYAEIRTPRWGKRTHHAGTTMRQAQKLLGRLHTERDDGTYLPSQERKRRERTARAHRLTFREYGEQYLADGARRWKGDAWHRDLVRRLNLYFSDMVLSEITREHVTGYMAKRRKARRKGGKRARAVKASTINHEVRKLRTMLNEAIGRGLIDHNPASGVKPYREEHTEKQPLDADQRAALIEAADAEFRPAVRVALLTGMRWGELAALKWADVDLGAKTARVVESKSDRPRTVPLVAEAVAVLKQVPRVVARGRKSPYVFHRDGQPLIGHGPKKGRRFDRYRAPWRRAARRATLTASPHITRHTFASEYVMRGGNPFDLTRICGWTDYDMVVERYGHLAPDYLQEAVKVISGVAG